MIFSVCALRAAESKDEQPPQDLTELSLEALMEIEVPKVYSASKFEQKATEAPSSVTVITSDEIKRYGYRTLAEALQSVQGFYVSYDRNYSFLGARGINLGDFNSRILVLVNGHRVNNNLTDGALIGSGFILDMDLIDRIEIIRGAGSVLYGDNAFFGVINVITRQGKQIDGVEASGEYGSFNSYKSRVTYGKLFKNGVEALLSGTIYKSDGRDRLFYKEFDSPALNNGVAESLDDDYFASAFGSADYRDFTLEGGFISRMKGNPTAQFVGVDGFNDSRLRTVDERSYVNLKYARSFPEIVDVTAQVYYDRNNFDIGYPQTFFVGTNVLDLSSKEADMGEFWGLDLQLNKKLWERHVITLGAEYRDDFRQERAISGQPTVSGDRQSHGVYLQGDFAVVTNLHLSAGVRYDKYGDFDPSFNPRLALIYNPFEESTIKAIYGTAFRTPNFLEMSLAGTNDLSPENITSYELVYEQGIGRHLRSSVSGFYNQIDDVIIFESGSFQNFDVDAKGVEFALSGSWTNGIRSQLSYTYQETEKHSSPIDLPDSPNHLFKFNISVPLWKEKVFAGLEYQFTSSRNTVYTDFATGNTVPGQDAASFGIVNLTLFSRDIVKNLEFSASIYNLLDCNYSDPATRFHQQDRIEQNGRTFRVKLTYRF